LLSGISVALEEAMSQKSMALNCYIGSSAREHFDPYLEEQGISHGLVMFAAPEIGLMFRCRAEGESIDLEFGAFFSLLKFLKTYLIKDAAHDLRVYSSNPEFVLSFRPSSHHLAKGTARELLLREFQKEYAIQVCYIESRDNRCLISPSEYPSLPKGYTSLLKPNVKSDNRSEFRPLQRGIQL
jgi:hypothetical protein